MHSGILSFPAYPAAFHRGCSPRLEGGYRGCRLCPTGVKIKAAISPSAREAVSYDGGLLWNRTPILDDALRHRSTTPWRTISDRRTSVRIAARYPPPPQTRLCTLNEISRVESISKIAIRDILLEKQVLTFLRLGIDLMIQIADWKYVGEKKVLLKKWELFTMRFVSWQMRSCLCGLNGLKNTRIPNDILMRLI